jgi:hypothetical protein
MDVGMTLGIARVWVSECEYWGEYQSRSEGKCL